jgi:hypothetical protein
MADVMRTGEALMDEARALLKETKELRKLVQKRPEREEAMV